MTGLNNFNVMSITSSRFGEYFGFSDDEVKTMLEYYGLEDKYGLIKEWYDGYCFGSADIYCPRDVINYVYLLRAEPDARPRTFWINSSSNAVIRTLLQKADDQTMEDLDRLVNGMAVRIIFRDQILSWFQEEARKDASALDAFCEAFRTGNAPEIKQD
ncbi:MAG: AAA family ATPase [Lachnospiraceae bacterium]